jgi:hypothetical protein
MGDIVHVRRELETRSYDAPEGIVDQKFEAGVE